MLKQKITSFDAPSAIGTYSQAIRVGNTIYCSGQIPIDPKTNLLVSADFEKQATQVFANLQAICQEVGGDLDNIIKLTIYLTDFVNFSIINEIMAKIFHEPYPARTTIQVSALPKNSQIEIEAVLYAHEL